MANEALKDAVKSIITLGKEGRLDEAYQGYKKLFDSSDFSTYRPEDQRQVLRLMIHAKGPHTQNQSAAKVEAHRSAIVPLKLLVDMYAEPSDYEMLGICHVMVEDFRSADAAFRAGLNIERERNPGSDLCGAFMKRISFL